MSTPPLPLPTTASEIAQLDPATLASIPGVAYDLKRLKVYSSCLRCRAKKVKCDRKEPCSRCEKHGVECSYRELASVQLDIRQFQRHLNNPKIRKDGAGIITSTATPIITLPSGDTAVLSPTSSATASLIAAAKASAASSLTSSNNTAETKATKKNTDKKSAKSNVTASSPSTYFSIPSSRTGQHSPPGSASSTDTESDTPALTASNKNKNKSIAMARAKVNKIHRRKNPSTSSTFSSALPSPTREPVSMWPTREEYDDDQDEEEDDEEDYEIERLVLRDSNEPVATAYGDVNMSSDDEHGANDDVPIWRAQAIGKHKQTAHEQDLAETFGLAAYLKAKEMELNQDPGSAGQTIDYDMELERALAQRMPTSFSRPDRSYSRARKYAQAGYNPALPYARPAHCQLSSTSSPTPVTAQCCCQIAAKQGQAPGTCFYSSVSHSGYENTGSSMSPPPQPAAGDTARIAYSPSYTPKNEAPEAMNTSTVSASSIEYLSSVSRPQYKNNSAPGSGASSPRIELPPIYLPKLPPFPTTPASSDLSVFQVGRDTEKPREIECKYNEPNVDAWDMIEKPISRSVPVTTKRGRSVKMEMGWILS
ncbi:hypothetical protein BG006_005513 [Podila minutissima]|uniref:Zn(2)-C6 fungal-type domain-containing protein n=1 Tax=Podila minutissima TaxID=64525 RepID=A0A9P5ST26_9FUNG|nr:hypothetical protein BG006_005513 [Podila minutissima]